MGDPFKFFESPWLLQRVVTIQGKKCLKFLLQRFVEYLDVGDSVINNQYFSSLLWHDYSIASGVCMAEAGGETEGNMIVWDEDVWLVIAWIHFNALRNCDIYKMCLWVPVLP